MSLKIERRSFSGNGADAKLLLRPTSLERATHDDTTGREVVSGDGEQMNLVHTPVVSKRLPLTRVRTSLETDVW